MGSTIPVADSGRGLVIKEKDFTFLRSGAEYRLTLEVNKTGRRMLLRHENKEAGLIAFYRVSGDELILCYCREKGVGPKSIDGGPGMDVYTLKRSPKP